MSAKSEKIIQAGDKEVRLLFTNRALAEVEAHTGKSAILIARGFTDGKSGVSEVGSVLRAGMEAARRDARSGGRTVSMDDAYEVMDQVGFAEVAAVVMSAIAEVIGYSSKNA